MRLPAQKFDPRFCHALDNLALAGVDRVCGVLRAALGPGLTPNMITTAGNVLRFTGLWLLYHRRCAWEAALFTFLGVMLDFVDGHYARKYGMVTVLGDYYDHVTDWVWAASLGAVLLARYRVPGTVYAGLAVALAAYVPHFAAREALRDANDAPTVQFTRITLLGQDPAAVADTLRHVNSDVALGTAVSLLVLGVVACARHRA